MRLTRIKRPVESRLRDVDAGAPAHAPHGSALHEAIELERERITMLQRVFYADGRRALLIVLQGRDTAGKDGTIRHVFSAVNPQGCEVSAFRAPTELEARHDFLWRVHQRVPARGMIGIFNRSHYEDVLVPRVRRSVPRAVWSKRFDQINQFEHMLVENNVVILKFFLHVSRREQKRRLDERIADPTKHWKLDAGDFEDRAKWPAFTTAYRDILRRCNTPWAPWYFVPADDKHVRNWLVARTIADALASLGLQYPRVPVPVSITDVK